LELETRGRRVQITNPDGLRGSRQRIYLAGFELQTFDRYPKCVGVIRDHCIALLVPGVDGLQMLGTPGWRIGEVMGVLTEVQGRKVFQAKSEVIDATPERLEALRKFREDLTQILKSGAEAVRPSEP